MTRRTPFLRQYVPIVILLSITIGLCCLIACTSSNPDDRVARKVGISREQVRHVRKTFGLSTASLLRMNRESVRNLVLETEHQDMARYREGFWAMLHRDEQHSIRPGALIEALRQSAALRAKIARSRFHVAGVPVRSNPKIAPTAGLHEDNSGWVEVGPWSIGGRTRAIAIDPRNPARMWLGSVGGGVWLTQDSGQTFAPVDDLMANLVVSTIVVDPTDSNKVYAGTGEGFFNLDALRGGGIFRTTDGKTWTRLAATANDHFSFVNRLAISADGKTLLAVTRNGIFVSNKDDRSDWSQRLAANIADVKFHPTNVSLAVAGGLDTGAAYFSEDGGQTWKTASHDGNWVHVWEPGTDPPTSPSRVELAYSVANPNVVYASVDNNSGEIWRSVDGGRSYTKMDSLTSDGLAASYLGSQGWYGNPIWAGESSNSDFLIVGGINLWKSTDGGKTLVDISAWDQDKSAHADHHVIASASPISPASNKTVFFGNDGGLFVTRDIYNVGSDDARTQGWERLDNHYGVTQFYGIAIAADGTLVGGAQDNGTLVLPKTASPANWSELFGGDGGFCAADTSDSNYLYGEYVQGNVHRRSSAGQLAEYISGQYWDDPNQRFAWKRVPYLITDAKEGKANFIAPFVLDPNDSNRMLVGGASLWRTNDVKTPNTTDKGPEWHTIKDPAADLISAIAVAKGDSNIVWVGYNNGDIFMTTNGLSPNPKWTKVDETSPSLPNRMVIHITIDPADVKTVYVTLGGYSTGNIWKTTNSGAQWINLAGALPQAPVFTLTLHPKNRKFVYAGTEIGIFASEDGGMHWSPANQGPNNSAVFDFAWSGTTLYAATHGRGAFKIELPSAVPSP